MDSISNLLANEYVVFELSVASHLDPSVLISLIKEVMLGVQVFTLFTTKGAFRIFRVHHQIKHKYIL